MAKESVLQVRMDWIQEQRLGRKQENFEFWMILIGAIRKWKPFLRVTNEYAVEHTYFALTLSNDIKLSEKARTMILQKEDTIYYSTGSVWEVSIKYTLYLGQMPISKQTLAEYCRKDRILDVQCLGCSYVGIGNAKTLSG